MSYGTNAPFGLQPREYLNGTPYSGAHSAYRLASGYATALFSGDPVVIANGYVNKATLGGTNPIMGVFWGVKYTDTNGIPRTQSYWAMNTATLSALDAEALIIDDPNVLYDVQAISTGGATYFARSTAVGPPITKGIGQNVSLLAGPGGSTRTGMSSVGLDIDNAATTANLQVKILRETRNPTNITLFNQNTNNAGTNLYLNAIVMINNNPYRSGGTGALGT